MVNYLNRKEDRWTDLKNFKLRFAVDKTNELESFCLLNWGKGSWEHDTAGQTKGKFEI